MKATEKEKSTVVVEPMTPEERAVFDAGVEGMRSGNVIPVLQLLLDTNAHLRAPAITEWSFHGPVDDLLQFMRAKRGPDGIPVDGADFVKWLRTPANAKKVRQAGILVSFPPLPRREGVQMIRVERAGDPNQYQPLVDGVRV